MDNELTITEVRLVQALLTKKSARDIADLIDKPVALVAAKISEFAGTNKKIVYAAPENKKRIKEPNQVKRADKCNKLQEREERLRRLAVEQQRAQMRKKEREPLFKTRSLDFSQMVSIRIDRKTIIYAKPGQDPEEVKRRYLSNLKKAV